VDQKEAGLATATELWGATAIFLRDGFRKHPWMTSLGQREFRARPVFYSYGRRPVRGLFKSMSNLISARTRARRGPELVSGLACWSFEAVPASAFHNASREDALELLESSSAAGDILSIGAGT